jgi:hypothetical protein
LRCKRGVKGDLCDVELGSCGPVRPATTPLPRSSMSTMCARHGVAYGPMSRLEQSCTPSTSQPQPSRKALIGLRPQKNGVVPLRFERDQDDFVMSAIRGEPAIPVAVQVTAGFDPSRALTLCAHETPLFTAKCQTIAPPLRTISLWIALHRSHSACSRRWCLLRRREHERKPCVPAVRPIGMVEFLVGLQVQIALRCGADGNDEADLRRSARTAMSRWECRSCPPASPPRT